MSSFREKIVKKLVKKKISISIAESCTGGLLSSYITSVSGSSKIFNMGMVVYSNYSIYSLFHSKDGGVSWTMVAGNLEQNPSGSGNGPSCRTAEIIPIGNDTLFLVGTSVGLYGTANLNGANTIWEQIAPQTIGSVVVEFLTYRQNDGLLVVGTHGNGIYQTNISSVGDVLALDEKQNNLNKITLYPNPTKDKLTLSFTTQKNTNTNWTLYTQTGKNVKSGKEKLIIGTNHINLDGA